MNGTRLNEERIEGERPLARRQTWCRWPAGDSPSSRPSPPTALGEHPRPPGPGPRHHLPGDEVRDRARRSRPPGTAAGRPDPLGRRDGDDLHHGAAPGHPAGPPPRRDSRRAAGAVALLEHDPTRPDIVAARPGEEVRPHDDRPGGGGPRAPGRHGPPRPPRAVGGRHHVRSVLCAPMWFTGSAEGADRVVGLVALEAPVEPTPFEDGHLGLVTAVVNLASSRLESIRLREETADMRRLEEDLRGAARIQASLLPEEQPVMDGWDIGGSSRLCSAVGADYYDFALDRGSWSWPWATWPGKGLAAALLMAALRAAVRALWREPATLPRPRLAGRREPPADPSPQPVRDPLPRPRRPRWTASCATSTPATPPPSSSAPTGPPSGSRSGARSSGRFPRPGGRRAGSGWRRGTASWSSPTASWTRWAPG